ncbi:hypothetical protein SH2C18_50580 [Clostridium sediminicola]|uniref:hypothetical protein n=1 Tax=Clostridium sediminicola TaxID=3114879 RepID=UPI0031F25E56
MVYKSPKSLEEEVQENIIQGEMNCGFKNSYAEKVDRHAYLNNKENDEKIKHMFDSYQQKYIFNGDEKQE